MAVNSIWDAFGVKEMPWIMRVYLLLVLLSLLLIFLPGVDGFNFELDIKKEIISLGKDTLKIVIGAIIGSLSMASSQRWGKSESDNNTSK